MPMAGLNGSGTQIGPAVVKTEIAPGGGAFRVLLKTVFPISVEDFAEARGRIALLGMGRQKRD